ncbi:MAG: MopE-related protein [Myxococcota bacterium]
MRWNWALAASIVMVMACNGNKGPEGPAIAELERTELTFGEVAVGTSAEQRVALSNAGGEPLEVLSVTLVQGDDNVWSISRDPAGDVEPGGSVDLVVNFSPNVADEDESGRVQIRTTDSDSGPLTIDLMGRGAPSTVDNDADGFSPADGDCDDGDDTIFPGAPELCDGQDNDCDGATPSDEDDSDRDGVRVCAGDCDDDDNNVYPGAEEICDDKDSDCDGVNPDRVDQDKDGVAICNDAGPGDCDDTDPLVAPGLTETCDGLDNDCSGSADDIDEDEDGRSVCRGDCDDDDPNAFSIAVDPSYTVGDSDGTDAKPFSSIEDGLAALEPTCHTLFLADDEYEVQLDLKDGAELVVQGQSRSGTVLKPSSGGRVVNAVDGVKLSLRDLSISEGAGAGDGGAIQAAFSDVALARVDLLDNVAGADGGAVAVASGNLTLIDVVARGNSSTDDGGAVAVFGGTLDADGCVFEMNSGNRGGALLAESSTLVLSDSQFADNTAKDTGGALQVQSGTRHSVLRVRLTGNTAVNGGGAIALTDVNSSSAVFRNLEVMENDGGTVGGGLSISGGTSALSLFNSTFTGNEATTAGAGIYMSSANASGVSIMSNIVAWSDGGSGIEVQSGSGAEITYNLVFATSPGDNYAGGALLTDEGNLAANPSFVDWSDDGVANDDLAVTSRSPARDAGPMSSAFNDRDGSRNDLGVTGGPFAR